MMESQAARCELSRADVANQLRALGVEGNGVLLVHTSFRAARPIEGGPLGLIEALRAALAPDGYGENDHCCARFAFADEWLQARGLQSERRVGHAHARLARARDIVKVALEHLAHDPLLFLHPPSAGCAECDEARSEATSGGPDGFLS
jgi:aminoglycoside N3'-acetyltransferase